MNPLILFKYWREGAIGGLVLAALFLLVQWKQADTQLKEAKLAYEHPQYREIVRVRTVTGPVRIVTRIVERPTGEKETTTEETHAEVLETNEAANESAPVPVGTILTPARTDRYLLTLGVNKLSSDFDGKALLVGYGFQNRLDIQVGAVRGERTTGWVFATARF